MLTFPTRRAKIVQVVVWCGCGAFYEVGVTLEQGNDVVTGLPDTCTKCLAPVDSPTTIAEAIDTAEFLVELGEVKRMRNGAA